MQFKTLALAGAMVFLPAQLWPTTRWRILMPTRSRQKTPPPVRRRVLLFNADMTYKGSTTDPSGKPVQYTGGWSLKDDGKTICLTTNLPPNTPNAPKPSCSPLVSHNVGDSWTVTTDQNQTFQISMTAGR